LGGGRALRRALPAAARLIESGPRVVVVTAGAAGAALAVGSSWEEPAGRGAAAPALRWFPAHEVRVRNPIGAGDAFVAGFAVALANGERPEDAVHAGMASAAASTEHWWPGRLDNRRASALRLSRRSCCGPLDSG
jgi:tagatose 6-phosphate kinase